MVKMRLDRYLVHCGLGSRKEIKEMIRKKRVAVDGQLAQDAALSVFPGRSQIKVDQEIILYSEFHYLMMNKPAGVISATDDRYQSTVIDLLPEEHMRFNLFPIGRLDKDTEGLLILSDDGQTAHKLLSPRKKVPKTYYAFIEGRVTQHDVRTFQEGMDLGDFTTLPSELEILESAEQSKILVTIYEGKFHQVKRMFEAVDKKVLYLKRIRMGRLSLDDELKPGEFRPLTEEEIQIIKDPRE